ncbi:protein similar isoform X2 [Phlebotomus papatasi]|uniref:protein similar isoform X2 n=1 Tax=Phlebotomus papatasi TaxID=29031 RepID=UPI0024846C5A|nr:protein similar isoform X2 [Phlebotomus papatasi]
MLTQQGNGAKPAKEKRRNNEKRKEKSRDAARTRRSRETEIFTELAQSLPLRREEVDQLDKASIMRLSIAFLKVRNMLELFPKATALVDNDTVDDNENDVKSLVVMPKYFETEKMILGALDGFLLVLSTDGDITYVSQNVAEILGIQQIDLLGQPIWDYSHQCDHEELREVLNVKKSVSDDGNGSSVQKSIFIRLKCTLTSRGRSVNIKSASYKVIHFSGHIATNVSDDGKREFIGIGRPMPHPSNIEIPLGSKTFLTKHSLDLKFSYVDEKMYSLLGYQSQHLLGKSLYELHHGADSDNLMGMFKSLLSKGQMETSGYRFLARAGGYVWVVTQATIVYDKQKPHSVVCVNYVISGIEHENEIFSCAQLEAKQSTSVDQKQQQHHPDNQCDDGDGVVKKLDVLKNCRRSGEEKSVESCKSGLVVSQLRKEVNTYRSCSQTAAKFAGDQEKNLPKVVQQQQQEKQERAYSVTEKLFIPISAISPRPESATQKIFVPRTEDMNKGFLMFSEEEPGLTMLKEEPDDLTHLAPTAGDACIPLEESTPFFSSCDVFDDLIDYCSLLPDDINSPLDSQCSNGQNKPNTDPFINYRDESSETSGSPHLLSPGGVSKSPEASSLPSLCSPNGSLQDDELAFMTMNMEDDIDLSMRAPYISMSEADDLPLLISEDLMWGAFPEGLNLHKDMKEGMPKEASNGNVTNYSHPPQIPMSHHQQKMRCRDSQQLSQDHQLIDNCTNVRGSDQTDRGGGGDGCNIAPNDIINSCPDVFSKNSSDLQSWPLSDFLQYTTASNTISPKSINTLDAAGARALHQQQQEQFKIKLERTNSTQKRPSSNVLPVAEFSTAKRLKNDSIATAPQLLQQLMAPTAAQPTRSRPQKNVSGASLGQGEDGGGGGSTTGNCRIRESNRGACEENRERNSAWKSNSNGQQVSPSTSNSVLMNLLVSGCDSSVSLRSRNEMEVDVEMDSRGSDAASPEDGGDGGGLKPGNFREMRHVMTNVSNPMIGGGSFGNGPSSATSTNERHKPGYEEDVAGFESLMTPADMEIWRTLQATVQEKKSNGSIRKNSFSTLIDSDNVAIPSLLLELSDQDYELNAPISEFMLQGADLIKALDDPNSQMT